MRYWNVDSLPEDVSDKVAVHVGGLKDLDGLHGICFCVDGPFRFTAPG